MLAKQLQGAALATQPVFVEEVFQSWLYTGTGSSQTITNNIDISTKGGLVWIKGRSGTTGHRLTDTVRGATKSLESNSTAAEATESTGLTAFGTTGFTIGADADYNTNAATYVSWTFREQAKFFDVVTYTGNGANRTIAHNLGSVPGCIIVKCTSTAYGWRVYHRSLGNTKFLTLNTTDAEDTGSTLWNNTTPTATEFTVGTASSVNANGDTFVAYLFAHDAGGFGATGSDNVISCGSYTGNGSATGPTVTLGYEPQWVMIKKSSAAGTNWEMIDSMRGFTVGSAGDSSLRANLTSAEVTATEYISPTATGFNVTTSAGAVNTSGDTYIYIAIRRGPMKTPTSGTSVFSPVTYTGNGAARTLTSNFPVDLEIVPNRDGGQSWSPSWLYRLAGNGVYVVSSSTAAEVNESANITNEFQSNVGVNRTNNYWNTSSQNLETFMFRRAPGFFDVVCYTGTGSATTFSHNLGVVPEMMIVKCRSAANDWAVYANNDNTDYLLLNSNAATADDNTYWNDTSPTASVFSVGTNADVNTNTATYVAYLFASVSGVSKIGTYTGNGSNQTINCGFTAGARFVLIKATSTTGDWVVFDSARGIVSGNDPYLLLNSTAAEVTTKDAVDADNSGFIVNETTGPNVNTNGVSYIYLAIS